MNPKFSNSYWTPDYRSGIDKLTEQSLRSIKQLHELRRLVFNYVQYFHSNSEYLNKLGIEAYPFNSGFRAFVASDPGSVPPKNPAFKRISSGLQKRTISQGERHLNAVKTLENENSTDSKKENSNSESSAPVLMSSAYEFCIKNISDESHTLITLASVIDREILEHITEFLKKREPEVKSTLNEFNELFNDYEITNKELGAIKVEYDEYLRLKEFSRSQSPGVTDKHDDEDTESASDVDQTRSQNSEASVQSEPNNDLARTEFTFPLTMGNTVKIKGSSDFSSLLRKMILSISSIRRRIPLPGYRNEIFSSDQICDWLLKNRPFGLNPNCLNMEKFGQSLLDLKLLTGTGIWSKKFRSEGMWFEWSELALQVANSNLTEPERYEQVTSKMSKLVVDENTSKFVNDMAQSTSKRFNGLFNSVKSSILKNNYSEHLESLEDRYNESYLELQEIKHLLDIQISEKTQALEQFEKKKIELVYQSLTKLQEIIYNFSLNSTTRLHKVASEFIVNINKPSNYQHDFDKLLEDFSSGIYFPSVVLPNSIEKQHTTSQSNNSFQNLKYQFNIFKDIPLQQKLSQFEEDSNLLSLSSLPHFLYQVITLIEEKQAESDDIGNRWLDPLDHQGNWSVKESIINRVNMYIPDSSIDVSKESEIHKDMEGKIFSYIQTLSNSSLVNFLKSWLLEISDSLIPCMVFDTLLNNYKTNVSGSEKRKSETIKLISTIPRSNLSSLIYLLEHICGVFDLGSLPGFGYYDEISDDLIQPSDESKLNDVAKNLNSMEFIGAVPFLHLIFRPSSVKHSSGFKPPLEIYNNILIDLLDIEIRSKLFHNLITNEKNYISKKENEKNYLNLSVKKISQQPKTTPNKVINTVPKSPIPLSGGDNFALRPFRTKRTPSNSPSSSPRHTPQNSLDVNTGELKIKKQREVSTGDDTNIQRSSSASFLTPNIEVEFEEAD